MSSTETSTAGKQINVSFLLAAGLGAAGTLMATPGVYEPWTFAPTGAVLLYGFVVARTVAGCNDRSFAEHAIDTVYYLGFLFTLFALVVLFWTVGQLSAGAHVPTQLVSNSMTYIGISVTAPLAGSAVVDESEYVHRCVVVYPSEIDAYRRVLARQQVAANVRHAYRRSRREGALQRFHWYCRAVFRLETARDAGSNRQRRALRALERLTLLTGG